MSVVSLPYRSVPRRLDGSSRRAAWGPSPRLGTQCSGRSVRSAVQVAPGNVAIHVRLLRKAQQALADDVPLDFVTPACDPETGRTQHVCTPEVRPRLVDLGDQIRA